MKYILLIAVSLPYSYHSFWRFSVSYPRAYTGIRATQVLTRVNAYAISPTFIITT